MRIAVTGGSGKLGRVVVRELRAAGEDVVNLDQHGERGPGFVQVDLRDYGQVIDAIAGVNDQHDGVDALVHLAAIPAPGILSDVATFHNNIAATFNVFWAAHPARHPSHRLRVERDGAGPALRHPAPVHPGRRGVRGAAESVYSLVKHLEEQLAIELVRWDPTLSITALRFSNVIGPEEYAEFPSFDADATLRKWNLWGYIDSRDGAQAVQRALDASPPGFERFIIAAADTVMSRPTPSSSPRCSPASSSATAWATTRRCCRSTRPDGMLGYAPQHSWRDAIG